MNARSFKVIFSKRLGTLVAVGEHASAQGKSASGEGARGAVLAAAVFLSGLSSAYALDPSALPTGHQVAAGQVQVTTSGARMDIGQFTDKAIVNWQSFNVGSGASVQIQQPSASSVLLNRVVGNDMSQIRGQISANGQVVLVNPNGIVMGPTGRITASAFTASTFGITDANFQNGNMAFERNGSDGKVVHQGHIQTTEAGGYVALIGAEVSNEGTIQTRQGAVVLAAADTVSLPSLSDINNVSIPLSRNVRLEINPAAFGSASVSNSGVIHTEGGQVFMRAAAVVDAVSKVAAAKVSHTGSIDTTGEQGGRVDILADHGTVRVSGTVTANSTSGAAGGDVYIGRDEHTNVLAAVGDASGAVLESRGGFVETSGSHLRTTGTSVLAKDWLLDPSDITISNSTSSNVTGTSPDDIRPNGGSGISSIVQVSTIQSAINAGTNVTIKTTNAANPTGAGNITIADALAFTNNGAQDATLSLIADNGITQNAAITTTGGSRLVHISMTANGNFQGNNGASTNSRGIVLNRNISTNGDITLIGTIDNPSTNTEAIRFNTTTISARKFTIVGTHNNTATASHGVVFNGTNTFTATEDSSIRGVTRGGSWPPSMGVYYLNGSNTTFNSGNGHTTVVGVLTGNGSSGTRVSFDSGANITTNSSNTGSVTLGSNEAGASFFHRRGTIRADSGTLNILGSSITTYEPSAIIQGDNESTINLKANIVALGTGPGGASHIRPESNGGFNLNIATDRLVVQAGSTTSSGTGTTTITTHTSGRQIDLGGADVNGGLVLTNAAIDSFTAGRMVIGGSTAGNIVVSQAFTTQAKNGDITLETGGNIQLNEALTIGPENNRKNLTLNAVGNNSQIIQQVNGVIRANKVRITGNQAVVELDRAINQINQLTAQVKSLRFQNGKALSVGESGGTAVAIRTADGARVTTTNGDLTIHEKIHNSSLGNVVVGAGVSSSAGVSAGGDVKTFSDQTISNAADDGKVFVYSGSAANTGLLSHLHTGFIELKVTGDDTQNTDTNAAFGSGAGISGSNANAQVIFREKVTITNGLVGTTVDTVYGDDNTKTDTVGVAALLLDTKTKLKQETANAGNILVNDTGGSANTVKIAKSVIIDSLNGTLPMAVADKNSSGSHIKAKEHTYGPLTSTKYTIDGIADGVKVNVAKRALTGTIAEGNTTYGDALAAGAVTLTNKVGSDVVSADGVTINTTDLTSTSGKLRAGTHQGIQSVTALIGADKDNYTFAEVKGNYKVGSLALNGAAIADVNTTYGTEKATGTVSFGNVQGSGATRDKVTATASIVEAATSSSGNLKAGKYNQTATTIDGDDSTNYTFSGVTTTVKNYTVDQKSITIKGLSAQDKTFDNSTSAKWSGEAELEGKVAGDDLTLNVSAANFNSPVVGSNKPVILTGALAGDDRNNYLLNLPQMVASISNAVEPVVPPTPVVPVTPPSNSNVVVSVAAASNNFQLAGADGQCSADALEECECESASSPAGEALDGIQICFASGSSTKE